MSTTPPVPMFAPDGTFHMVPNHLADQAATQGGGQPAVRIVDPSGTERWAPKDKVPALLKLGAKLAPLGSGQTATEIAQGISGIHPWKNPAAQVAAGLGRAAEGIVTAPYQVAKAAFTPPTSPEEVAVSGSGPVALAADRMFVEPAEKALSLAKNYWTSGHPILAGMAALGATPILGPMGQSAGERMASGDIPGAVSESAANAFMMGAPKTVASGLKPVLEPVAAAARKAIPTSAFARSVAKSAAGISPLDIRDEAQSAVDANRTAAKAAEDANKAAEARHYAQAEEAAQETRGREAAREHEVRTKAEEIAAKEATEAERMRLKHEKELQEARRHNEQVKAKHAAVAQRIQEENAAQENVAQLRQQKEAALKQATDEYRAQEETTDKAAKDAENEAWGAWRGKIKGATIDGAEIAGPLKKLRLDSPEVDRTLRQLEPSGDEVPQESPYARLRDETARSNFQGNYADLSPLKRDAVDAMMVRAGESPEPIDLNPEEGQPISVERVQRANSILQRYIRSGRFEGPLLGEMKQVAKVLRRAVTEASEEHGALDDLDQARAATVSYQEAFGRERPEPKTVRGEREKAANPEEVKRIQEEERLEAAAKYDPSLSEAQRKVKTAREELKNLPSEDQLRKGRKQVPAPPSVNHPYEAYRLREEPPSPPKRLASGSTRERAGQQVPLKDRVEPPDRPPEEVPERKTLSPGGIAEEQAKRLREFGLKKLHQGALGGRLLTGGISTWALAEALRGEWHYAAALGAARLLMSLPTEVMGRLLANERIARWIAEPTPHEIEVYKSLTPDQKAVFDGSLDRLTSAAKSRGMKVSPVWIAAAAAAGGQKPRLAHPVLSQQSPVQ